MSTSEAPIRALEILPSGVALLDPQERALEAMLQGWKRQQRSRHLKPETVERRLNLVNAVVRSTDKFPWHWTEADFESFSDGRPGQCDECNSDLRVISTYDANRTVSKPRQVGVTRRRFR